MPQLQQQLKPHLIIQRPYEGEEFLSVTWAGIEALAAKGNFSLIQAMTACLQEGIWPERLRSNRGSFSAPDQIKLLESRVAQIGAGGLGGMVCLQLARLGLGGLTVVDGDSFDQSNLNRQFLSSPARLERPKAACAAVELAALCPYMDVRAEVAWADEHNLPGFIKGAAVVVDCLDNMPARYLVEAAAHQAGVPFVHGALAGLEGFVMVSPPGGPGLAALYGPQPSPKSAGAELRMGVPTMTPAMVAGLQVNETVKLLLGRPALDAGTVLHLDLTIPSLETLRLG